MSSPVRRLALVTVLLASAPSLRAQERALAPLEVRPSPAFQAAVAAGTRSLDGTPGGGYWQQRADYAIEVTVEPRERRLTGRETIAYTNHSPDTLRIVTFHLYQNLVAEGALRGREVPLTGGMGLGSLVVDAIATAVPRLPFPFCRKIMQGHIDMTRRAHPGWHMSARREVEGVGEEVQVAQRNEALPTGTEDQSPARPTPASDSTRAAPTGSVSAELCATPESR